MNADSKESAAAVATRITGIVPKAKPGYIDSGQATYTGSVVHRKVSVKGTGGVSATVVVTVQQGQVWMSIQPPFTWETILEPEKVDELIRTLALATNSAKKMARGRDAGVVALDGAPGRR